ncbi:Chromosome (plasmid) partitioning protein ParB [hydrothermal vent metagenome]|uniref:Chromosome (Plasmid) partitioning protein ParB n=1 Tax=hydrothermal vent metagenome TaxID=652676 RepID=A0A3B0VI56_9ZZZZ
MQQPTKYDSVFWIETEKIHPNPYQPRRAFDDARLRALAESIRQYGVLQPLVVTRFEHTKPDGGIASEYELIAGERRLRASKLIGLREVPAVIRAGKEDRRVKLELAIIENLQREDLNAIDRAKALAQLADEFGISHSEIGAKVGRSREYVSNSIRLLRLPEEVQMAVVGKEISEGHARALLMLAHKPKELDTLFRDIVTRKTSVRVAEQLARRIATDKIRKKNKTPEMMELEKSLTETLGTRVIIENRPNNTGRLLIEFFSPHDLVHIADVFSKREAARFAAAQNKDVSDEGMTGEQEILNKTATGNTNFDESILKDIDRAPSLHKEADEYVKKDTNTVGEGTVNEANTQTEETNETIIVTSDQDDGDINVQMLLTSTVNANKDSDDNAVLENSTSDEGLKKQSDDVVVQKPEQEQKTEQDNQEEDLYSIRNFTV